jgi:hypothetical protein
METIYQIPLENDEERIAQLLTRDAWSYFASLKSTREPFHIKEIPLIPRRGVLSINADEDLIQYYLDHAEAYTQELALLGWDAERVFVAADGFASKLESISGQLRGRYQRMMRARLVG